MSRKVLPRAANPMPRCRERILSGDQLPKWLHRKYWRQLILATPPWADFKEIRKVYQEAADKGQTVDHIVPLNHPRVSGLHVHWNLRVIPAAMNYSKGNAWCEWHGDLFNEPEQLRLF